MAAAIAAGATPERMCAAARKRQPDGRKAAAAAGKGSDGKQRNRGGSSRNGKSPGSKQRSRKRRRSAGMRSCGGRGQPCISYSCDMQTVRGQGGRFKRVLSMMWNVSRPQFRCKHSDNDLLLIACTSCLSGPDDSLRQQGVSMATP